MIAATRAVQRPPDAKLLAIDARGRLRHLPRRELATLLRPGDVLVANDAATLPASLHGVHARSGRPVEVRLAQRRSLDPRDVREFVAIVFGAGDYRTRTEDREPPPRLEAGDTLVLGPLRATVERIVAAPRLVALRFAGDTGAIWAGLARHGRPIQYAHLDGALAMWDVWTPIAALPAAFEPPSAGFALDWDLLGRLRLRGVAFTTLTHAAGISSTGDAALDARLPLDEPYRISEAAARAIDAAREHGGRVVAVGTTVVRALESAATVEGHVRAGDGVATLRIGPGTRLHVVDAVLTGTHEPGTSHHALMGAFAGERTLARAARALEDNGYRTHEFGDSIYLERGRVKAACKVRVFPGAHARGNRATMACPFPPYAE